MTGVAAKKYKFSSGQELEIVPGDICDQHVAAIVNAANSHLRHGGGLAAVIARRGGAVIQSESDRWVENHGPVTHMEPAYTTGGNLPCRYVIHAVGPVWGSGNEDEKLTKPVKGCLWRADQMGLASLAIPPISTGIFSFPIPLAAPIMYQEIRDWFQTNPESSVNLLRLMIIIPEVMAVFFAAYTGVFTS